MRVAAFRGLVDDSSYGDIPGEGRRTLMREVERKYRHSDQCNGP